MLLDDAGGLTWHQASTGTVSADNCFDIFGIYECYDGLPEGSMHNSVLVFKIMPNWYAQICVTRSGLKSRLYNAANWGTWN